MKILTSFARIFVGLLFIFSGFIKSNDPKGTGIKLNEYFDVFASDFQKKQDSLLISYSDNHGRKDSVWEYLNVNDSLRYIEVNRSALRKVMIENETDSVTTTDSVLATELFIVFDNNKLFSRNYTLKNQDSRHTIHVSVVSGSDSILLDRDFTVSADNKLEEAINLNVYPLIKQDNFMVGFFRALKPYSVLFSVILCILEIVLGFAILIGWKPRLIMWVTLITILFFSFLTWYSAFYNKVTDCGCFGDFIKLEPWTSFYKDLVLTLFIGFLFYRRKQIVPFFSKIFSWNMMTLVTIASISFTVYCNSFLPIWDFLPYKVGNNIKELMAPPPGQRAVDSVQLVFIMEKAGTKKAFNLNDYSKASAEGWKYVDRKDSIIIEAWKSPIHDFDFSKRDENDVYIKDSILNGHGYQLLIISGDIAKSDEEAWEEIKELSEEAKEYGIHVYAVTSSSLEEADLFVSQHEMPFRFNNADNVLLKTMMRSNPGIIFWKDATVLGKWSCNNIPEIQKLRKIMQKS